VYPWHEGHSPPRPGKYPFLEPEDFQQVLRYAAATVDDERLSTDQVA
jgi:hypothetical protein